MVDIGDIRQNPEKYKAAVVNKNAKVDIDALLKVDAERKGLMARLEDLRRQANEVVDEVKKIGGKPPQDLIDKGKDLKERIKLAEAEVKPLDVQFQELIYKVPNLPSDDTPIGEDDSENVVLRKWGQPRNFEAEGFSPKEHWQLGEELGLIDIERAVKVSGARFAYLKGDLALLQFALMQLGLEKLTDENFLKDVISAWKLEGVTAKPFVPVIPPVIINPEPFARMARLEPREERYYISGDDQYLIGSAEHTLGAMYMDETLAEEEMPVRYLGYSTSFRREAGSYGKDMKGILRLHQFDKLEMESFTVAEASQKEQDFFVAIQEKLMQLLGIPYQILICCTGDQGDPDARHLDLESWMPGQNRYRETHSADLMTDYQSRRLNTKVRRKDGEKQLVHMNDATAFAVGRTLIAIMENYQQADGSIIVPEVLRKWVGKDRIINRT